MIARWPIAALAALIGALGASGCATPARGALLGAAIGGGGGAAWAYQTRARPQALAIDALIGAAIGAGIGYLASPKKAPSLAPAPVPPTDFMPKMKRPEVRKIWVPDQISGEEFIQGHWKYSIDRPAVWSKEE
jgi:hypothetical protein